MAPNASQTASPSYAGDIDARAAWDRMKAEPAAQLIDVRTLAEWNYVGIPDVSELSRTTLFCEWQDFPRSARNPNFTAEAAEALRRAGHVQGAPIFLLCRSGARSHAAAIALTQAGYGPCFNVKDGFEGSLDEERHRGRSGGWKAEGLPWIQS